MWIHNLNPTLLTFGPLEIRWYGLVYVLGFFLALYWLNFLRKRNSLAISAEEVWDLVFYVMVGVLIGARLFMIFWQPQEFLFKPWNLLKIWQGGMSFHGGFVGSIVAVWFFCKKKKLSFLEIADALSLPAIFALALGRIANFVNGELVGRIWQGQWCVVFLDYDTNCRHPSTLYAAGYRFLIFGWLLFLSLKKEFKPGFIFWNFVLLEGIGRIIVDFYRQDILYAGFSLGQWFSAIMVAAALWIVVQNYSQEWKRLLFR
ncbi:MAG: prolipoprotein diacylglyceryl transferase [Nanoarchaeota archaeon]|nr:prolipoprotein diacylglyceryl transferase [Nanoarchaeota archaeon]